MERLYIRGRVIALIRKHAELDTEGPAAAFSIETVELTALLESEFDIRMPPEMIRAGMSIDEIVEAVERLTGADDRIRVAKLPPRTVRLRTRDWEFPQSDVADDGSDLLVN
jgi:acyl carrier protein